MADEYDVFDQGRLNNYQNGSQVKRFVMVPIELIRSNNMEVPYANQFIIDSIFKANPNATLVVDYGDAEVADGFSGLNSTQLNSVRHISFVGERIIRIQNSFLFGFYGLTSIDLTSFSNIQRIGQNFLDGCAGLTSVDLRPLSNVQSIDQNFLSGCRSLTSVDLSPLRNVTSIGASFLSDCSGLILVDLSSLPEVSKETMRAALRAEGWNGTTVG